MNAKCFDNHNIFSNTSTAWIISSVIIILYLLESYLCYVLSNLFKLKVKYFDSFDVKICTKQQVIVLSKIVRTDDNLLNLNNFNVAV